MKLPRRSLLHLAVGAAALPAVSPIAWARTYPSRPVHIIVGYAAGGAPDILARLMGQWLSERLGQSFVVENRPGANGDIASETVVKAPADGRAPSTASLAAAARPKWDVRFTPGSCRDSSLSLPKQLAFGRADFPSH